MKMDGALLAALYAAAGILSAVVAWRDRSLSQALTAALMAALLAEVLIR
jgi:hypothetical protein